MDAYHFALNIVQCVIIDLYTLIFLYGLYRSIDQSISIAKMKEKNSKKIEPAIYWSRERETRISTRACASFLSVCPFFSFFCLVMSHLWLSLLCLLSIWSHGDLWADILQVGSNSRTPQLPSKAQLTLVSDFPLCTIFVCLSTRVDDHLLPTRKVQFVFIIIIISANPFLFPSYLRMTFLGCSIDCAILPIRIWSGWLPTLEWS